MSRSLSVFCSRFRRSSISGLKVIQHCVFPAKLYQISQWRTLATSCPVASPCNVSMLQRNWLVGLDWDETLTTKDTMASLIDICKARDERLFRRDPTTKHPFPTGVEVDKRWDQIVKDYMDDRASHKARHFPSTTDAAAFSTWLASLDPVEKRSIERVEASRIFAGVRSEDVSTAAKRAIQTGKVQLRDGWIPLFQLVITSYLAQTSLEIFSVNWSELFIRECLLEAAAQSELPQAERQSLCAFVRGDDYGLRIHANEISGLNQPDGSDGRINGGMHTSVDKSKQFALAGKHVFEQKWLYIGDSPTDFGCFVYVHTGVWLRNVSEDAYKEEFAKTFAPFDHSIERLTDIFDREPVDHSISWSPDLQTVVQYLSSVKPESEYCD